ncbi:hypothetical protein NDA16_002562 [Ustilago loliicola]|nr:hypothetical protein NDA16_002562 [Ustilago loliicola]
MTAATAPSPSPAPSAPPPARTPSRQSSTDAIHHVASDGSTRRHDASTSASPSKVTPVLTTSSTSNYAASSSNLGTLAKPIDLASPPASPTLTATNPYVVASEPTRPSHQPSPSPARSSSQVASTSAPQTTANNASAPSASAASSSLHKGPPYGNALSTPNRLLPPTPLGNTSERASATSPSAAGSTPSKPVQLPAPYKAPRLAQSGASESFATAYPTQETRQKYASPSKPLSLGSGVASSHKRSWQSNGSVDLSNKKIRFSVEPTSSTASASKSPAPSAAASTSPSAAAAGPLASASTIPRPLSGASAAGRAANASSGVTVTNIPKPGSSLSNQAGVGPLNLIPAVSGTQLPASVRDEYLSLLQKSELIDLVKQLERQLNDLIAAPTGSSTLYRQARIYPNQIHTQIDRLKVRQRIEASRTPSPSDLSLKDVYSLLNAGASASKASTYTRTPGPATRPTTSNPLLTGQPAFTPSTAPRRPYATTTPATASTSAAARGTAATGTAGPKQTGKDTAQNASLANLINSINAMVRQQAQPARGSNGAPLPPAHAPTTASAARFAATAPGKARPASGSAPTITPAALRSIVGDGPMPSNAALAAAIAAHFGGNLPGNTAAAARQASTASTSAPSSAARAGAGASKAPAASTARAPSAAAPVPGPGKDISDKIAAILGSSSSSQTTMLGPQGLPLAPAAPAPGAGAGSAPLPIGNIAAMLSSFSGQPNQSSPLAASTRTLTPAGEGQESALSSLLQQLEEAKKRLPSQAAASPVSVNAPALSSSANSSAVQDPIAILTGASANPVFTPAYSAGASAATSPEMGGDGEASWSPEPESVIVQGPLGTSTLPSYEEMIVEGLRIMGQAPPRELFNWMQVTYPLMKKFRPSAHQALQKAAKRGRLLKTGSKYRINPNWKDPGESRKPTRRPQVGRDHPMVTPGLNGEVLAVSPLKDSQAYRSVADSGIRTLGKGMRPGPRPYGQPGAAPLANPASSIFQNGSAASIILEYQKRTGKKLDADSVKQLYQLIRAGPSDGSAEEILAYLLTQTGYHDAAAEATAAATMSASYSRPSTSMPAMASGTSAPVSAPGRTGAAASAAARGRMPTTPVAKGPTSLPLPATSEPTMMQQLASMLNDLSSPINPVLANSLLGQLSSNAAAAAAARAANMPGMSTGPPLPATPARTMAPTSSAPPSASSQLASALSSLAGQTPQQDLDSAVSETLAAALQQIGAAPTATASASEDAPKETALEAAAAPKQPVEAAEERPATEAAAPGDSGETEEGIDLAEYEDAIRALTSAFGKSSKDAEDGDSEESDVEADERAIAAAEAEPDSVEDPAAQTEDVTAQEGNTDDAHEEERQDEAEEGGEDEEDEEDGEQMDLFAVLRQLTASLQAHQQGESEGQGEDKGEDKDQAEHTEASALTSQTQNAGKETDGTDDSQANKDASEQVDAMDVDKPAEEARDNNTEGAQVAETEAAEGGQEVSQEAQAEEGSQDAASLQAQLEALVASLAANAGNADDDDEDDDDEDDEEAGDDDDHAEQDS